MTASFRPEDVWRDIALMDQRIERAERLAQNPALITDGRLPENPYDGQRIQALVNMSLGIRWGFEYRDAAPAPYKWESINPVPYTAEVTTGESTAATSFADLSTIGPQLVVPFAGDYVFHGGCKTEINSASNNFYMSALQIGSVAATDNDTFTDFQNDNSGTATRGYMGGRALPRTVPSPNTTCKMVYRTSNGAAVPIFRRRTLSVIPVRVG